MWNYKRKGFSFRLYFLWKNIFFVWFGCWQRVSNIQKRFLVFLSKMSLFLFWLKCFGAVYIQTENIQWLFEDKLVTKFDRKINFLFWKLDRFAKFHLLQCKQIVGILQLFWFRRVTDVQWLRQVTHDREVLG